MRRTFVLCAALLALPLLASAARAQTEPAPADSAAPAGATAPADSTGIELARAVLAHVRGAGILSPAGKLELVADASRRGAAPKMAEGRLPEPVLRGLAPVVEEHLGRWGGQGPVMVSFRLDRIDIGQVRAADDGSVERLPELANREEVGRLIAAILARHPDRGAVRDARLQAQFRLKVDRAGEVVHVEVAPTGDPAIDGGLLALGYAMRFRPAEAGGRPVPVWVVTPVGFYGR